MQSNAFANTLRQQQTDAERMLWLQLRNRRLYGYKFCRQLPIGPYIADFVCLSAHLIIELDGGQHATAIEHDERRTTFLQSEGYEVIRFWNHDVLQNLEGVLTAIVATLRKHPHPNPLP